MKVYNMPTSVKTLIFDIDSTLYTNEDYAREQVDCQIREMARMQNVPYDELHKRIDDFRADYAATHDGASISLGNTLVSFGVPIEQSIAWRRELLEPERYLSVDHTLQSTLQFLTSCFALIVVTNNPVLPARKTLAALGVTEYFSDIIGLDTCGVSKPHRKPLDYARIRTAATVDRCVSIGDRYDIDIALPLEMGMGGILVDGVADVYRLSEVLPCVKVR